MRNPWQVLTSAVASALSRPTPSHEGRRGAASRRLDRSLPTLLALVGLTLAGWGCTVDGKCQKGWIKDVDGSCKPLDCGWRMIAVDGECVFEAYKYPDGGDAGQCYFDTYTGYQAETIDGICYVTDRDADADQSSDGAGVASDAADGQALETVGEVIEDARGAQDALDADVAPVAVPCVDDNDGGWICDDKVNCTEDKCDLATKTCTFTPKNSGCHDGKPCTVDHCVASGTSFTCTYDLVTGACDDGDACTGQGTCLGATCVAEPLNCNDGNPCTTDSCQSGCQHLVHDGACDLDGSVCTPDVCVGTVCTAGAPNACDDGSACTLDACNAVTGCSSTPLAAGTACNDGAACTTGDGCTNGVCAGTPLSCAAGQTCIAGACAVPNFDWAHWKPVAVPSGFTVVGDTVSHALTGRVWQRGVAADTLNFAEAVAYCEGLALAGHSDWRLPTAVELMSVLDLTVLGGGALIDATAFPNTPVAAFWSGTAWGGSGWSVGISFDNGNGGPIEATSKRHVRCIR